ncbi:MAG: universal stress protein [Paracoccus sp. (in: a-proteobacteria)]|uniref:universal stress protein n=1 Tax=Paracoccus sp. TaxID=267 RepID=UPI0026DF6FE4|nr:universal stress protein [Paracoccus sp. (in: a-proteobacteria)]MDO5630260.1 universal stress protein [Paracoccus sp. (in: a-proteobacteria)]
MTIRSILTNYTGNGGGPAALRMSIQMAQKYDASLTAAVWVPDNPMRRRAGAFLTPEIDKILDGYEADFIAERRDAFEAAVAQAGLTGETHFEAYGTRDRSITEIARGHDIVVIGSATDPKQAHDFGVRPDVVALRSGRPVLVVPSTYDAPSIIESAAVAWDGKRAAARALADAMHILGTKDRVILIGIGEDLPADYGADVMRLMERHGIDAELVIRPHGSGGTGQTIIDTCLETGVGLLVMGAYEHSKFTEDLLGGVTRDIFERAPLPVLMSH